MEASGKGVEASPSAADSQKEEDENTSREKSASPSSRRGSAITLVLEVAVKNEKSKLTRRQWILLIFLAAIDLFSSMTVSLQAPFYPAEAELKGASGLEYGLVFGIFEFVIFLTCPIFGQYMNRVGLKLVFTVSIMVTSVAVICFGLLDWVMDHTWFITLSFICRIFEALGFAGFITATFVIIAAEFPQSVATTFASLETVVGIGFLIGPAFGGALYGIGGFSLPFFVTGGLLILTGVFCVLLMPKTNKPTNADGTDEQGYGILTILKIPSIALAALSIVSTAISMGYVSATLEPHIRRFGLTPLQTGIVFIVNGGVYALIAPFWGYLCDNVKKPVYITILGNVLIFVSSVLIGPADFVPVETTLWLTIVGLVVQGLGMGCCFVSTFIVGLKDCMEHGIPDNMALYAVVSGLFQSMISLGAMIGPSLGGFLYDTVGFREGSWLMLATSFIAGIAVTIHACIISYSSTSVKSEEEESQPLLKSSEKENKCLVEHSSGDESTATVPSDYGSTSHA